MLSDNHSAPYSGDNRYAKVNFISNSDSSNPYSRGNIAVKQSNGKPKAPSAAEAYKRSAPPVTYAPPAPAVEKTQSYTPSANRRVSEPVQTPAEKYKLNTSSENQSPMPNNNLKIHSFEGGF